MKHSAILPTENHAHIVFNVIPGNPQLALSSVMIHDVNFNDASKISELITRHGLPPLAWDPPITKPAEPAPASAPAEPEAPESPEQPT